VMVMMIFIAIVLTLAAIEIDDKRDFNPKN
jgi:hypothetical protein